MIELEKRLTEAGINIDSKGTSGSIDGEDCYYYVIPPNQLETAWKIARQTLTDAWPIIVPAIYNSRIDFSTSHEKFQKKVKNCENFKIKKWFDTRWKRYLEETWRDPEGHETTPKDENYLYEGTPDTRFGLPFFIAKYHGHLGAVELLIIPKLPSFLLPIYLRFGGVNSVPLSPQMAGILKYWNEKYGAELAGLTYDSIELYVKNPPQRYDETLAREMYILADEVNSPHARSVEDIMLTLPTVNVWLFWWD